MCNTPARSQRNCDTPRSGPHGPHPDTCETFPPNLQHPRSQRRPHTNNHCEITAREHATLAAPADAVIEGFPIGKWLENKRAQDRKNGLGTQRHEALDSLVQGEPWNPPHWPVSWQRRLTHATELLTARGDRARLDDIALDAVHRGEPIGRWVARQRAGWDKLNARQRAALEGLGLTPPGTAADTTTAARPAAEAVAEPSGPKPKRTREQAFEIALSAAAAYRERVGHLEVPRGHVETVVAYDGWREDVRLGVWITTTRTRRPKLPAERITALDALGRTDVRSGVTFG